MLSAATSCGALGMRRKGWDAQDVFKNLQFFSSKWDRFLQAAFALTWKYGGTGKTTANFQTQQLENVSSLKCYCKCLRAS